MYVFLDFFLCVCIVGQVPWEARRGRGWDPLEMPAQDLSRAVEEGYMLLTAEPSPAPPPHTHQVIYDRCVRACYAHMQRTEDAL